MPERGKTKSLRCAIYTRKSSEEGLEQDFNSLQAQREACESFIASQKLEGWKPLTKVYDDGGYSGGSMERPALRQLLADITGGHIDVVVVYKVDRLTRSLADFAKIVEIFDAQGVSFVSVTQQFNTTSSMGRLTLNVLLSFAQFEREVTGERIRDKVAASKKKGMWMGGWIPLGYDLRERALHINDAEAKTVRAIFRLYLKYGNVRSVQAELERRKITTKRYVITSGRTIGGLPFGRGHIYYILANPLYVGEIRHKDARHPGQHPAIVDRKTWGAVQAQLGANGHKHKARSGAVSENLLAGLLFDEHGNRLTPTHSVKNGKRYRYYAVLSGAAPTKRDRPNLWIAASEIERVVIEQLAAHLKDSHWLLKACASRRAGITARRSMITKGRDLARHILSDIAGGTLRALLLGFLDRVTLGETKIRIDIGRSGLATALTAEVGGGQRKQSNGSQSNRPILEKETPSGKADSITIIVPAKLRRHGGETKLIVPADGDRSPTAPDAALTRLVAHARQWCDELLMGRFSTMRALAEAYRKDERYVARVLTLAFVAPSIIDAIAKGSQPVKLTAHHLLNVGNLPLVWRHQNHRLN